MKNFDEKFSRSKLNKVSDSEQVQKSDTLDLIRFMIRVHILMYPEDTDSDFEKKVIEAINRYRFRQGDIVIGMVAIATILGVGAN